MKDWIKKLREFFYADTVNQVDKNFHLVSLYGIICSTLMVPVFIIGKLNTSVVKLTVVLVILQILANFMSERYKNYELCSLLYCLTFNLVVYPLFYFLTADIYNGIAFFFIMGIVITFFMLRGKKLIIVVTIELLWHGFIIFYSYFNRDVLTVYREEVMLGNGIGVCFVLAMFMPVFVIRYETIIYEKVLKKALESNQTLNNAKLTKSRFLANMTHEIRTPMNAIVGMNELILREDLSPSAREHAETIKKASSELLTIINNILVYSKLDSQKMELLMTKYSFKNLIMEVTRSISLEYNNGDSEFNLFVKHDIPSYLYGDDIRIKQIFHYLLFSSMHQLPHGRISLEVNSVVDEDTNMATIKCRVAEMGRGMTEAEMQAVFGAYNQYDSRQRSDFKGMGLELFICREILNMMGGSLTIESIIGVGIAINCEFANYILDSTPIVQINESENYSVLIYLNEKDDESIWKPLMEDFKISPVYVSKPIAFKNAIEDRKYSYIFIPDDTYETLKKTISEAECENYTYIITNNQHVYGDFDKSPIIRRPITCLNISDVINGKWKKEDYSFQMEHNRIEYPDAKVLVVDDSLVNIRIIMSLLETFGIKADMATSGSGCLNILEKNEYNLVLLDQLMPEMDGIQTLHGIRKLENGNRNIPIICVTADFGADVAERLNAEGFNDYVSKPVKDYYLERILKQYLPERLAVLVDSNKPKANDTNNAVKLKEAKYDMDPLNFTPEKGIENVGGDMDAYASILCTYYSEGVNKLEELPHILEAGDIPLYTTTVHALKSSSASVGALGISPLFKKLEYAGKEGRTEIIQKETEPTLSLFSKVLETVHEYLTTNNMLNENEEESEPEGEVRTLNEKDIKELSDSLAVVNLKRCEEIINELSSVNYGKDFNEIIREIKNDYEMFNYPKVKEEISKLLEQM